MPYSISGTTITVSGTVDLRSVSLPTLYGVNFAAGGASATFHGMTFAAPQPPGNSYVVVGSTSSDVLTLTLTSLPFGAGWTRIDMTFFSFASWSADDLIVLNGDGNDDVIWASSQKETINGGGGNDSLSSRTRDSRFADTLHGGEGNDTYYVHPSDLVDESDSGGIDTIESDLSYDLRTARILGQVENLILTATDFDSSATGNALDNKLVGGLANNTLNGLGGDDFMQGRRGSDTYVVDTASDIVD
jgi:Ca2+-binding RTX toxin-like protein